MVGASSQQKWQMTICKLSYQFRGSLVNDNRTLARIASSHDDLACGAVTDSANLLL